MLPATAGSNGHCVSNLMDCEMLPHTPPTATAILYEDSASYHLSSYRDQIQVIRERLSTGIGHSGGPWQVCTVGEPGRPEWLS